MSALPSALRLTCCRSWLLLICLVFLVSSCSCRARQDPPARRLLAGDDLRGASYNEEKQGEEEDADVYDDDQDYLEENITAGEWRGTCAWHHSWIPLLT